MRPVLALLVGAALAGCPAPDPRLLDVASAPSAPERPPPPATTVAPIVEDATAPPEPAPRELDSDTLTPEPEARDATPAIDSAPEREAFATLPLERREVPRAELVPPPELLERIDKTPDGLPILAERTLGEVTIAIAYDARLDDPIARWGDCVDLIARCGQQREVPLAACVETVARCPLDGGAPCCPSACVDPLVERLRAGGDAIEALRATVLTGACVPGLAEERARARVYLESEP